MPFISSKKLFFSRSNKTVVIKISNRGLLYTSSSAPYTILKLL